MLAKVAPSITILKFIKSNTINVRKGAAIDIPAEVRGLPLPTLQWMKDDVVIEKTDEEKMTMETEEVRTSFSFMVLLFNGATGFTGRSSHIYLLMHVRLPMFLCDE